MLSTRYKILASVQGKRVTQLFHCLALIACFVIPGKSIVFAQQNQTSVRTVRTILPSEWNVSYPAGVAFSTALTQLHLLEKNSEQTNPLMGVDIVTITPYDQLVGTVHLDFAIDESINIAYADDGARLFLLSKGAQRLAQIKMGRDGLLDPATLQTFDISWLDLDDPQGMSVDRDDTHLYILDSSNSSVIKLSLIADSGVDDTQAQVINLWRMGMHNLRGIAVHPLSGDLFVGSPLENKLYQMSSAFKLVASFDTTPLDIVDQRAIVFAPSADLTDPQDVIHLYLADSNLPDPQPTPVPTAPTSTPIATAPTATPIATAPTSTPVATAPATEPTLSSAATKSSANPLSEKRALYLPVVTNDENQNNVTTAVPKGPALTSVFGKVIEVELKCTSCPTTP